MEINIFAIRMNIHRTTVELINGNKFVFSGYCFNLFMKVLGLFRYSHYNFDLYILDNFFSIVSTL